MIMYKQIKGEELYSNIVHKAKTFSIGSQFQWGTLLWEIEESTATCSGCYFFGSGKCFCRERWFELLGECSAISRVDDKNVVFKLRRL